MKTTSHAVLLFLLILTINGCATIVTGSKQTLSFNSEPDGATISINGNAIGKTPTSIQLKKDKHQILTFQKEGYKTYTTEISTTINNWFWGNILIGGLFGSTTDGVSGSMNEFSPDQYFITLTPDTSVQNAVSALSISTSRKVKELIIAFGSDIRLELASGGGEKVDALLKLIHINQTNKATSLTALNKLALQEENDLEFAKLVIQVYDVK